jgi:hypothetical protein
MAAAGTIAAAATSLIVAVLPLAAEAQTQTGPHFPRLGAYPIGSPHNYESPTFRDMALRYHVVIVSHWPGWQSGRSMTMAQVMQDISNRSTVGTKLFIYVNNNEQADPQSPSDAYYPVWQKLNVESWWLYANGTSGTPVRSTFGGGAYGIANNTDFTPIDSAGKNWIRWKADFDKGFNVDGQSVNGAANAANPHVHGFAMDNVFWKPRVDGDWNRDGTSDSQTDPTVQGWLRSGSKSYFDHIRLTWPGSLQIGNIADWGQSNAVIGVLDQVLDGGIMEGMIGFDWSVETWGGFGQMMAWYRKMIDAVRDPKLAIFGHHNWLIGDYRSMRYGLASALMDDGYYYISGLTGYDPSKLLWFDEFSFDLGYPTQVRQTAPWSQGVWRRDFQNGIVLVNPKGNGIQIVELGGTFRKLSGTQDPVTNNGLFVSSVTLLDRDGIILSR